MTLAIIAMVMVSCMIVEEKDASEVDTSVELVFEATLGSDDYTKSSVQSDESSVWWSAHERINLFFADSESSLFTSTNDAPSAKVQFRGTIEAFTGQVDGSDAGYFWGIYPYDASNTSNGTDVIATLSPEQVACPGTFADNQWLAVAHSQGLSLSFRAVCAGFRFSVTKEGVKSVTFKGNNNEILAGKARIGVDENNLPVVLENLSEEREITLSAPEGETLEVGTLYYMTFFPNIFTKGFTVTFNTEAETGIRIYNTAKDFKRTDVHRGVAFDKDVEYVSKCSNTISFTDSEVKRICVDIAGWDTDGDGEISFDEAAEVKSLMKSATYSFFSKTNIRSFNELQFFTGLTSIEFNAFYQCDSLVSITLPPSVISISPQAFMRCYNLNSITLPSNIEVIDRYAFSESGLNSIIIPGRVSAIGYGAFEMMDNLKEVIVEVVDCPSGSDYMFSNTNDCPIFVPAESVDAYKSADYWSKYADRILPVGYVPVKSLTLDVSAFELEKESSFTFTATILPENSTNREITWTSSVESVATVTSDGVITAHKVGNTTVYAECSGIRASCSVEVVPKSNPSFYSSTDYSKDGEVLLLQQATVGKGINIILLGDGFVDQDMAPGGKYEQDMKLAMEQFFAYEPFTSFRDRFNIYTVKVVSKNSEFTEDSNRKLTYNEDGKYYMRTSTGSDYGRLVPNPNNQPLKIAVVYNTDHWVARSWCFWDSSGWSCCFVFAPGAVLNHELGGHGFANLYDEYVEKNESFSSFEVLDNDYNNYGFGANVDWHNTISNIRWSRLMNDSRYSEEGLGIIEGGYLYARGIYRATENSMMRYNDSPFNAPSREQIYKRIMKYSEGDDWQYDYETFVSVDEAGRRQAAEAFSTKVNSTSVRKSSSHEKRDFPPLQIDSGVKAVGVDDKGNIEIVR